jgi:hypothetical protein
MFTERTVTAILLSTSLNDFFASLTHRLLLILIS